MPAKANSAPAPFSVLSNQQSAFFRERIRSELRAAHMLPSNAAWSRINNNGILPHTHSPRGRGSHNKQQQQQQQQQGEVTQVAVEAMASKIAFPSDHLGVQSLDGQRRAAIDDIVSEHERIHPTHPPHVLHGHLHSPRSASVSGVNPLYTNNVYQQPLSRATLQQQQFSRTAPLPSSSSSSSSTSTSFLTQRDLSARRYVNAEGGELWLTPLSEDDSNNHVNQYKSSNNNNYNGSVNDAMTMSDFLIERRLAGEQGQTYRATMTGPTKEVLSPTSGGRRLCAITSWKEDLLRHKVRL